jgi:hypothetical protein
MSFISYFVDGRNEDELMPCDITCVWTHQAGESIYSAFLSQSEPTPVYTLICLLIFVPGRINFEKVSTVGFCVVVEAKAKGSIVQQHAF